MKREGYIGTVETSDRPDHYRGMIVEMGECDWTWDIYTDSWNTGCGNKFQFTVDGPKENNFEYCPYCGRIIREVM